MYSWSSTRPIKLNNSARDRQVKHTWIKPLGKLFTFCSLCKLPFTSWLFVVVSRADKHFEKVQNWLQTTVKHDKSEVARLFVYHSSYNYLTWECFEVLSSSFRTSLSYNTLIFDLCNRFQFINLLSLLIFIKSNRCILEVKHDR